MRVAIHQPDFLPYLGFFYKMLQADIFVLYDTAQYSRRGYHNRNRVKTSHGTAWLTIPVRVVGFPSIRSVEVDSAHDWPRRVWRRVQVNYGRAPYFDRYAGALERILKDRSSVRLVDLNVALLGFVRESLGIATVLARASELPDPGSADPTTKLIELTRAAGGDTYVSGPGGRGYLDPAQFKDVSLEYADFRPVPYPQLWGDFEPNLSVLDALLNCGPEARALLTGTPPASPR